MTTKRRVSYSQYSTWLNCPLEWKLKYIDKAVPADQTIHLIFGTAIHHAIQTWLEVLYTGDKFKTKILDVNEIFKEKLLQLFKEQILTDEQGNKTFLCDKETLQDFYLQGCEIINYVRDNFYIFFPTAGWELVGCEIPLNIDLTETVSYIGYIDIVIREKNSGQVIIYDLKTSGKGWNYEKKDPKKLNQLLLYKHFYSKLFEVDQSLIDVKFIILKRLLSESKWDKRVVEFEPAHGQPSVNKALDSFSNFISVFDEDGTLLEDNIKPTPSKNSCRFCIFKNDKDRCTSGVS